MLKSKSVIVASATTALLTVASCSTHQAPPTPAFCGQTADHTAVITLSNDAMRCSADTDLYPNQKQIIVAQPCAVLMEGSAVGDDCYRGNIPGLPSPDVWRRDFILANGGTLIVFVASDLTAV